MKRSLLILAAFILLIVVSGKSYADTAECVGDCSEPQKIVIEYTKLSDQTTEPFRFNGKIIDEKHPRWRQYKTAIRRYPSVSDCLVESEQDSEAPNLLLLDWDKVFPGPATEVCVYRIARSLGTVKRVEDWLVYHKFTHRGWTRFQGKNFKPYFPHEPSSLITGRWTVEQYREKNPSIFAQVTGLEITRGYKLTIAFDEELRVVDVDSSVTTKLN